jgi:Rrf2 family protein
VIVSRGADYAIRAMLELADHPEDERAVTEQIAIRQEIPGAFLSKVIAQLTQAGLLRTYRGAAGGLDLGKPAEEINLRQIIEAVQGPIVLNVCTGPYNGCRRADTCAVAGVFKEVQASLNEVLEQAILANLVREAAALQAAAERGSES